MINYSYSLNGRNLDITFQYIGTGSHITSRVQFNLDVEDNFDIDNYIEVIKPSVLGLMFGGEINVEFNYIT